MLDRSIRPLTSGSNFELVRELDMATFPHACPHCDTSLAPFEVLNEYRPARFPQQIHAYARCGICSEAVAVVFFPLGGKVAPDGFVLASHLLSHPDNVQIVAFYPPPATPNAPDHLPPNVEAYFLEAAANVKTGPNAAGAMLRKTIDVALKHMDPDLTGKLVTRIDKAAKSGKLTPQLAEWAHHVRLEGNDAVHDDDPFTVEEAAALHKFTELVLMYLFTLPGMLEERRGEPAAEAEDATSA